MDKATIKNKHIANLLTARKQSPRDDEAAVEINSLSKLSLAELHDQAEALNDTWGLGIKTDGRSKAVMVLVIAEANTLIKGEPVSDQYAPSNKKYEVVEVKDTWGYKLDSRYNFGIVRKIYNATLLIVEPV